VILSPAERDAIRAQAIEEYPHESCGVVLVREGERRLVRCRNIQNELHGRDPLRHPRDARTAYYIDPADLLRIGRLESEGFAVAVIYHSHVDVGAYFSATDKRQALLGEDPRTHDPMYPEAAWVVTSVVGDAEGGNGGQGARRVAAMAAFRWDPAARDFQPVDLELPAADASSPAREERIR
jgi:proteasome lid subunit RPN8/RPN11